MNLVKGALVLCIFVIIVSLVTSQITTNTKEVNIPQQGSVLGIIDETSWTKQTFYSFRGIPYAESPSGNLRFKPPKPRAPWETTLDARNFGKPCPSMNEYVNLTESELNGDLEDCLTLNVYSKKLDAKQPVMFYTHGGVYVTGSAKKFAPHYLLEKDIVLVVIQYRVGALGFMSTLTDAIPGNMGLLDILMSLEWVQKNIHVFGGDPNKVTIFGQSAGGGLTSALLLTPKAKQSYFNKAIVQSSSMMAPWCINREPLEQVKRICEGVGCESCKSISEQYDCLKNIPVMKLLNVTSDDTVEMFAPVVGDVNGVLPEEPKQLLAKLNRTIPLMIGFTKHDGSFLVAKSYRVVLKKYGSIANLTVRQFANILIAESKDNNGLSNNLLLRMFFKDNILDTYNHDAVWPEYIDIASDVNFKSPVIAYANAMKRLSSPVYLYSFDYVGESTRNENESLYPFKNGISHSTDNYYLFKIIPLNSIDTKFAKKMVNLWYTFAVDGEPKIIDQPNLVIKPMKTESGPYFHINSPISVHNTVLKELTATVDDPEKYKLIKKKPLSKKGHRKGNQG